MMTGEEFEEFLDRAREELEQKQALLMESEGFGQHKDFWFDQLTGKLQLKDANGHVKVEADVTLIGSFSPSAGSWQWAWSNESVVDTLRKKSERFKELGAITSMECFTAPGFDGDQQMAWDAVAMCVSHSGAMGCYRMPAKRVDVFAAIDAVTVL
jgi:hypothetical protein